jgi:hypothetical protein
MESRVTKLIESAVSNVGGIKRIIQLHRRYFEVMLEFAYGTTWTGKPIDKRQPQPLYQYIPVDASKPTIFKLNTNMVPI